MTEQYSPELVERMVALVRSIGAYPGFVGSSSPLLPIFHSAQEIHALLPEPVDPDLIEARHVAGEAMAQWGKDAQRYASGAINLVRTGNDDESIFVTIALAGIKRGRELAARTSQQGEV